MNLLKKNQVKMLTKLFSNLTEKLCNFYIEFSLTLAILVALFYRWHRIFGLWFFFASLHTYKWKKNRPLDDRTRRGETFFILWAKILCSQFKCNYHHVKSTLMFSHSSPQVQGERCLRQIFFCDWAKAVTYILVTIISKWYKVFVFFSLYNILLNVFTTLS